jgi:hypothetical protein
VIPLLEGCQLLTQPASLWDEAGDDEIDKEK